MVKHFKHKTEQKNMHQGWAGGNKNPSHHRGLEPAVQHEKYHGQTLKKDMLYECTSPHIFSPLPHA